jgi:DNA-binding GntR family transcriptional regulator
VDIVPRRGASVAATSPQDVREIFFLRKHLITLAAAAAAERITHEQVEALRKIMHRMEDATGQADLSRYFRGNLAFYDTIVDIAGIGRLQDLLQYLGKSTLRYRFIGLRLPGGMSVSLQANREVLDALASRDSAAASRIVFRMVERAGEVLSAALEQGEPGPPTAGTLRALRDWRPHRERARARPA